MALTFAAYAAPPGWEKPAGVAAVVALAAVNYVGVTRTAGLTRVIVAVVLAVLALVVVAGLAGDPAATGGSRHDVVVGGWYGILQSAGLLFFAFAGYARIATMGEEVKDPRRVIPRAIVTALTITVILYAVVASVTLVVLGPDRLAASTVPLADVATAGGWDWAGPVVRAGAAAASLGALLALIAGVGRTALAMARNRDLPGWLSAVHPRHDVPHHAELALAAVVCALVLTVDLRGAIGFSSFGVLLYYFVANVSAFTQTADHRRYPRVMQLAGSVGCLVLLLTLPAPALVSGVAVLATGVAYRLFRRRGGRA
jgi:APA family basic amino acid/polyamine antiporter